MTTVDLLQRYPSHRDSISHDKASRETKAFASKEPDPTVPSPSQSPPQYFNAKTKSLHEMLDRVVLDLATSQSEGSSEFRTLWRSPQRPRSRSPTYSEISESFESPGRIEHCTNNLLSTPMSPTSAQFAGPDGWPLGIEVAMNDFHRGRLSTSTLEEKELPNRLIVRKRQRGTLCVGGSCNREGQEIASCESIASERQCDGQNQRQCEGLEPLAPRKGQNNVCFNQRGERQDPLESASLKRPAFQQQSTRCQQQSECRYQQESVELHLPELREQKDGENDGETHTKVLRVPTLSTQKYGEDQNPLGDASTNLHPALANSNVPIGLCVDNAGFENFVDQSCGEEHDASHTRINGICLLHNVSGQTTLKDKRPHGTETNGNAHQTELRISALADAFIEKPHSSKVLGVLEDIGLGSINPETDCQSDLENSVDNTFHTLGSLTSEDSKANSDGETIPWKSLGLLEDILEETEDLPATTLTLRQGWPQHFALASAESLDLQQSSRIGGERDNMLAIEGPLTESSTQSSSPPCALLPSNLTINASSKLQLQLAKPSKHRLVETRTLKSILSAASMAELKDPTRKKGYLSAAALGEMRKTAESQPHFQTGPESPAEQSQAGVHPLLRSKSFSRPFFQPSNTVNDSGLKYFFEDDESEGYEAVEGNRANALITLKRRSLFEPEAQDAESFVTPTTIEEHARSHLGKMGDMVPWYISKENDTEGQGTEYAATCTPQRCTPRSSNDSSLIPSLENATPSSSLVPSTSSSTTNSLSASVVWSPDLMSSSVFQPSISPATTCYYPNSAITSPAPSASYNSWASTQHHCEHGNSYSTPSSAAPFINSMVPSPITPFHTNAPIADVKMTPSSSFGQSIEELPDPRGIPMTPSSSFGGFAKASNETYQRSVSFSSMFARYHKERYPDLPTAARNGSILSSKESTQEYQVREVPNDPFTSSRDVTGPVSLSLKAPDKENLTGSLNTDFDKLSTPTKRSSGRFGLHRRSLSIPGRPNTHEGIERALSTLVFNPQRSRPQKRSHNRSASTDTTAKPGSIAAGLRRSLSVAANSVDQRWEVAPPPTPLNLRDEFSMRYRPEPLTADDHYASRKDALQGMKQGLRKVFGLS